MPIRTGSVTTPSGVRIAFDEAGPAGAPACVLIHGIAQSRACFRSLLESPLAERHRLVAFDLRGHGEYLRRFGERALRAVVLLAASIRTGREAADLFGPVMMENARALISADAETYATGARRFLDGCVSARRPPEQLEAELAQMLHVPAQVRRALLSGGEDYTPELRRLTVPLVTLHGSLDTVVKPAMSELIASLNPRTQQHWLAGVGHAPWLEAPAAFQSALAGLLEAP
jgi:pimeloyl-ACP methyl ester carboxylesterase